MSIRFKPVVPAVLAWRKGTPYAAQFDDIYFSAEHGIEESMHVFINGNDLIARYKALVKTDIFVIGELGFGTGLNCLLAWQLFIQHAPKGAKLVLFSAEKHPLCFDDLSRSLSLWPTLSREAQLLLADYPTLTPGMHTLVFEDSRVTLHLMLGDALEMFRSLLVCGRHIAEKALRAWHVDAWFLDGFAPSKHRALWSEDLLRVLGLLSHKATTVATFSVAGEVRRHLEAAGFVVSKRVGFRQKRHCLSGMFKGVTTSLKKSRTPWVIAPHSKPQKKQVIVVGAGLAGCFTAHLLAKRGFQVTVLDAAPRVAEGASGVHKAVLYPQLSGYASPLSEWMLHAFLFAHRTYAKWLDTGCFPGELKGLLQFNAKHASLDAWLTAYKALAHFVDADTASRLAGVSIGSEALFVPSGGWIDTPALCRFLIDTPGIDWRPNTRVDALRYEDGLWHLAKLHAPVVVLANGAHAAHFPETRHLPLELFRGQMTAIQSNTASSSLKLPLCGSGHVLPAEKGMHWVGASFHPETSDTVVCTNDNQENLAKLAAFPIPGTWSSTVCASWSEVRAKTPDYLPLVGPVPDVLAFQTQFSALSKDGGQIIEKPGAYYSDLYMCAGFGSRGLTSVPLAAAHLVATICHEPAPLLQSMVESIAPARFLLKQIKQGVLLRA
ncbi:MAG: bifunctional tRNA (5-methylaminomethyl-2-thiouridine)(34)-methyltransferase MnmD/FAD-dependent 5-carboxymethylaminomethyl-2-thiouridine(34) oxidoreductase MnmC [Legionellaceae bacterium]|nr:bifunctional tRNA (5-methylaminomethyl-2-thiouridine)(34)-methyltransferase MnmD/FAD-dependent 5-carboxymethylaminomethyl-2-thiouridine(34) oxidoreductase MnmC [Legionellaceae bacterium]